VSTSRSPITNLPSVKAIVVRVYTANKNPIKLFSVPGKILISKVVLFKLILAISALFPFIFLLDQPSKSVKIIRWNL